MPRRPPPPSCTIGSEVCTAYRRKPPFSIVTMFPACLAHHDEITRAVEIPRIGQISVTTWTDQSAVVMPEIGRAVPRSCARVPGTARTFARARNEMNRRKALISMLPLIKARRPSADRVAAIHHERVTDHQGCGVAAKPKDSTCNLLGATKPADRHFLQHRVERVGLTGSHHLFCHRRTDKARTNQR